MRFTQSWLAVGALVVAGFFARDTLAKPALEERMDRIELLLKNKVTLETLNEIENLKKEIQQLHGALDEQQHAMEVLTQRQEKLFLDLEQRINQIPKNSSTQLPAKGGYNSVTSYSSQPLPNPPPPPLTPTPSSLPEPQAEVKSKVDVHSLNNSSNNINNGSSEQDLYNAAYKLVDAKQYKEAIIAFQDFLWKFPDGKYAANVHYWLGEIHLSEWHNDRSNKLSLDKATSEFKIVISKYAKHHKAADSLLKLGIIAADQENWLVAKEYFIKLKQQYPGSSRAHMAEMRLQKIPQQ